MDNDDFGARMKQIESVETSRKFDVTLPTYARIDGRGFSRFTRGMDRPFDLRMTNAMIETTKYLVQNTHARIGYVQSDEISLVWEAPTPESDIFFSGKIQKMVSVLASMAAAKFARVCPEGFEDRLPHFDARVFQMPSRIEAANAFLWRAMDAKKNSISMVAQANFSHKELQGKTQKDMLAMLAAKGVDFEANPEAFKRGSFIRRVLVEREPDLSGIPEQFRPTGPIMRAEMVVIDMPPFNTVRNRVEVVFDGADPVKMITLGDLR